MICGEGIMRRGGLGWHGSGSGPGHACAENPRRPLTPHARRETEAPARPPVEGDAPQRLAVESQRPVWPRGEVQIVPGQSVVLRADDQVVAWGWGRGRWATLAWSRRAASGQRSAARTGQAEVTHRTMHPAPTITARSGIKPVPGDDTRACTCHPLHAHPSHQPVEWSAMLVITPAPVNSFFTMACLARL